MVLEPVATMAYLVSKISEEPSFFVFYLSSRFKLPQKPSKTVTLFLSIKKLIPLVVWSTTSIFREPPFLPNQLVVRCLIIP